MPHVPVTFASMTLLSRKAARVVFHLQDQRMYRTHWWSTPHAVPVRLATCCSVLCLHQ